MFNVLQQLEALGLNVPAVLQQLGINQAAPSSDKMPATVVPHAPSPGLPTL